MSALLVLERLFVPSVSDRLTVAKKKVRCSREPPDEVTRGDTLLKIFYKASPCVARRNNTKTHDFLKSPVVIGRLYICVVLQEQTVGF